LSKTKVGIFFELAKIFDLSAKYKTKARGYEPRTFFPFISCYRVRWLWWRMGNKIKMVFCKLRKI